MNQHFAQSGQVGIAVILMMVVMSTVGFALATRSSRDVQTSRQAQDAAQAFAAAEAIVESVLTQSETALEQAPSSSNFQGLENIEGSYEVFVDTEQTIDLQEGTIVEVPLAAPGQNPPSNLSNNSVAIEWAESTQCADNPASIVVSIVNSSGPTTRVIASAGCDRSATDNIPVSPATPTSDLSRRVVVPLQNGDIAVRVTPLYNSTPVRILAAGSWSELPSQQYRIRAVARNSQGRETKAIQVERTRSFSPSILNYSLVSGNTLFQ